MYGTSPQPMPAMAQGSQVTWGSGWLSEEPVHSLTERKEYSTEPYQTLCQGNSLSTHQSALPHNMHTHNLITNARNRLNKMAVQHLHSTQLIPWHNIVVRLPVCKLFLSCTRLTAGRVTTLSVKQLLSVDQHGQLSQSSLRGRLSE